MNKNIYDFLHIHSRKYPDVLVFSYQKSEDAVKRSITYSELDKAVNSLAIKISGFDPELPILLIYEDVLEFIVAFIACQKAGIIAVPMFYPKNKRHFLRLAGILDDIKGKVILTEDSLSEKLSKHPMIHKDGSVSIHSTSYLHELCCPDSLVSNSSAQGISFIQYTSGSTGDPKGVIVSHVNLISNLESIKHAFGGDEYTVILSWLPFYHDMGLIGNILYTIYLGCTCILLSPVYVVQNPAYWLQTIARNKVTHSGGPNFIYDLCVKNIRNEHIADLNLSSWSVAYNGSEPVKKHTIDLFIDKYKRYNFSEDSFYTCYGLAEATLLVSAGKYRSNTDDKICSGQICDGLDIKIIDPEDFHESLQGEICLLGKSVSSGYWNSKKDNLYYETDGLKYLRTGDLGFRIGNELFINGRIKEMIIINGVNLFPYDLEDAVSATLNKVSVHGVIVSSVTQDDTERILVFAEVSRNIPVISRSAVIRTIDQIVIEFAGTEALDIILVPDKSLPRTSSGKLQRTKCRQYYLEGHFMSNDTKRNILQDYDSEIPQLAKEILTHQRYELVRNYLILLLNDRLKCKLTKGDFNQDLIEMGINSLKCVEVVSVINRQLKLDIKATWLLSSNSTVELEEYIINLLWLKSAKPNGGELTI